MLSCCFSVAKNILEMKNHTVNLESGYKITVEARPVQLVVPRQLEVEEAGSLAARQRVYWSFVLQMDAVVCSRCIWVSDLPQMDVESLVDKLGFHFSKKANGGGEVQSCRLEDSRRAVIEFAEEGREETVEAPLLLLGSSDLTFVHLSFSCRRPGAQGVPQPRGAEVHAQSPGDAVRQRTDEQTGGDRLAFS